MSYEKVFDDEDIPEQIVEFAENRDRLYALIEKHPVVILPIMNEDVLDGDRKQISSFLYSLFAYNGVVVTFADGIAIDPAKYEDKAGPYKHSKGKVTEFLILSDVHDESGNGWNLMRLAEKAASECGLPFIARIRYPVEPSVDIFTPTEGKDAWEEITSKSILSLILQSRSLASPAPKLDLPLTIEYVYSTVMAEKKIYKLAEDTPVVAYDIGSHPHSSWSDFPLR